MAKSTKKAARKPRSAARAAKAPKAPIAAKADTEFQGASGAEAKPEGAAASTGQAEAKAADGGHESAAADPAGTAGAPAAQAEESRGQAPAAPADRKGADGEENQPEDTAQPPVAGIVVIGPKNGRWRSGLKFGRDPVLLDPAGFMPAEGEDPRRGQERLYAILTDPKLRCFARDEDGNDEPIVGEAIEALRRAIDEAAAEE